MKVQTPTMSVYDLHVINATVWLIHKYTVCLCKNVHIYTQQMSRNITKLEGKNSVGSTDPRESEIRAHLSP